MNEVSNECLSSQAMKWGSILHYLPELQKIALCFCKFGKSSIHSIFLHTRNIYSSQSNSNKFPPWMSNLENLWMNAKTAWCVCECGLAFFQQNWAFVWNLLLMLECYGHSSVHNKDVLSSNMSASLQSSTVHIWIFTGKVYWISSFLPIIWISFKMRWLLIVALAFLIYAMLCFSFFLTFCLQHIGLLVIAAQFRFSVNMLKIHRKPVRCSELYDSHK